jgi:hypothetical protein
VSATFQLQRVLPLSCPVQREQPLPTAAYHLHSFPAPASAALASCHFLHAHFPELCPSPAEGFTHTTTAQLTRLPTQVLRVLDAASRAELMDLWPTDCARALLHRISTRPDSLWLDAIPYAPSLR